MIAPPDPTRVALLTGMTSPVGLAVARALAQAGFALVLRTCDRSGAALETLADDLRVDGATVRLLVGDAENRRTPLHDAARHGPFHLLLVLAPDSQIGGCTEDVLRALPDLVQGFANLAAPDADASVVAVMGTPRDPCPLSERIARTSVHAMTKALALALAPGVRVNAVSFDDGSDPASSAGSVADATLYLARARTVTGQVVPVARPRREA